MTPLETVQACQCACAVHDWPALRRLLDDRLQFAGPMMKTGSADEFVAAMQNFHCQFENRIHRVLKSDDGWVASLLDCIFLQPFQATVRMSEWVLVRDGRIRELNLIFDPKQMPQMPPA